MCGLINKANSQVQIRNKFILSVKSFDWLCIMTIRKKKQKLTENDKLCLVY